MPPRFFFSLHATVCMWLYVCVFVCLASGQKQFRLSSCHVPQEPRSFPAQHITLQHYREISWWKMRLILDGNYCSIPQAPRLVFFFSLTLFLYISVISYLCLAESLPLPLFFLHLSSSSSPPLFPPHSFFFSVCSSSHLLPVWSGIKCMLLQCRRSDKAEPSR